MPPSCGVRARTAAAYLYLREGICPERDIAIQPGEQVVEEVSDHNDFHARLGVRFRTVCAAGSSEALASLRE
jgi:hypothetical protein